MSMRRYDLPREKMNFDHLKLLYVSTAKYGSDWCSTLHSHKCSEIFYIVSGRGDFHVESAVFSVRADQLVIINSNVEHTESSLPQDPMEYIVMGVEGCDLLFEDNDDCRYSTIDCGNENNEILNYMQMIVSEMEKKTFIIPAWLTIFWRYSLSNCCVTNLLHWPRVPPANSAFSAP